MSSSTASKVLAFAILALAPASRAGSPLWSVSFVNEPYYLAGAFHPAVQGSLKLDHGRGLRTQTRLSMATEAYGLFEPRRDPRAWDVSWGLLGGAVLPFWGWIEASAGVGAVLGRTQGELYYRHVWSGGLFPEESLEYRERTYLDVGVPFQVQWQFGRDPEGIGLEYSGFISRESRRWGLGLCWQYYIGPAPRPEPVRAPVKRESPRYESDREELED